MIKSACQVSETERGPTKRIWPVWNSLNSWRESWAESSPVQLVYSGTDCWLWQRLLEQGCLGTKTHAASHWYHFTTISFSKASCQYSFVWVDCVYTCNFCFKSMLSQYVLLSLLLIEGLYFSPINRTGSPQGFSLVETLHKTK